MSHKYVGMFFGSYEVETEAVNGQKTSFGEGESVENKTKKKNRASSSFACQLDILKAI